MTTEPPGDVEHKLRAQSSRAPTRQYHLRTEGASRHQSRADQGHTCQLRARLWPCCDVGTSSGTGMWAAKGKGNLDHSF